MTIERFIGSNFSFSIAAEKSVVHGRLCQVRLLLYVLLVKSVSKISFARYASKALF